MTRLATLAAAAAFLVPGAAFADCAYHETQAVEVNPAQIDSSAAEQAVAEVPANPILAPEEGSEEQTAEVSIDDAPTAAN